MAIKYKWLAEQLEERLMTGRAHGGPASADGYLPTEAQIAAHYHLSRQTVRAALKILEEKGLIERRQGSGTYLTGLSAQKERNRIAVLISNDQDYIYPTVLHDIRTYFDDHSFATQVHVTGGSPRTEREILLSMLQEGLPRGILVEGCRSALPSPNLDLYLRLHRLGCPVVFLFANYPALSDSVYVKDDNRAGGALLVRHLVSRGHQTIGGLFKYDDIQGQERYQGYAEALLAEGLSFDDRRIGWYGSAELEALLKDGDNDFLRKIVRRSFAGCSAVICYNDLIAYHLLLVLKEEGFHLPKDMALAAFDNTYLSDTSSLSITTLSHDPHAMGRTAARTLLQKIKGLPAPVQEIPWILIPKQSTEADISGSYL